MPTGEQPPGQKPAPVGDTEFDRLLAGVAKGDQRAVTALYERYGKHIMRVIRHKYLNPNAPLRLLYDSDDFAQDAWRSLFEQLDLGTKFPSEAEFTRFMEVVLRNRIADAQRRRARELQQTASRQEPGAQPSRWESHSPGPAEQAESADEWDHLEGLLNERELQVLAGLQRGETTAEIASRLGISVRTMERDIERIHGVAQGWEADPIRAGKRKRA
jgi:RNA polymerase sigma factor (sigma-70 family)